MKAIILDTETTGLVEPEIVSAAWVEVGLDLEVKQTYNRFFKPSKPIELGAMAVHHIIEEDLLCSYPSSDFALPPDVEYIIGHNIDYDWKAIGSPDVKRIDTLAFAWDLWPDIGSHKLAAMMYHLFPGGETREKLKGAHDALHDVHLCRDILGPIIEATKPSDFEHLWQMSESARVPKVMRFGKHEGLPISEVPRGYKMYLLRDPNCDPYLAKALRIYLYPQRR